MGWVHLIAYDGLDDCNLGNESCYFDVADAAVDYVGLKSFGTVMGAVAAAVHLVWSFY